MEEKSLTSRIIVSLNNFLFVENQSPALGILRMALVLTFIYVNRRYYLMNSITFISHEATYIHKPSLLMQLLSVPFPLAKPYASTFALVYYTTAFCAFIGFLTRPALFLLAFLSIYIFDITASRGLFDHGASLVTQVFLILAFAPGTSRFSLDRVLYWKIRGTEKGLRSFYRAMIGLPTPVWGIKTILILLAVTYCTAGLSKLRYGGVKWIDGQTLTYYLDGRAQYNMGENRPMFIGPREVPEADKWKDGYGIYSYTYGNWQSGERWLSLGKRIASNSKLMAVLSTAVLVFELCGFMILISGWPRIIYLASAIVMHKIIGLLMGLPFVENQLICLVFIDWKLVYQWLHNKLKCRLHHLVPTPR